MQTPKLGGVETHAERACMESESQMSEESVEGG